MFRKSLQPDESKHTTHLHQTDKNQCVLPLYTFKFSPFAKGSPITNSTSLWNWPCQHCPPHSCWSLWRTTFIANQISIGINYTVAVPFPNPPEMMACLHKPNLQPNLDPLPQWQYQLPYTIPLHHPLHHNHGTRQPCNAQRMANKPTPPHIPITFEFIGAGLLHSLSIFQCNSNAATSHQRPHNTKAISLFHYESNILPQNGILENLQPSNQGPTNLAHAILTFQTLLVSNYDEASTGKGTWFVIGYPNYCYTTYSSFDRDGTQERQNAKTPIASNIYGLQHLWIATTVSIKKT